MYTPYSDAYFAAYFTDYLGILLFHFGDYLGSILASFGKHFGIHY